MIRHDNVKFFLITEYNDGVLVTDFFDKLKKENPVYNIVIKKAEFSEKILMVVYSIVKN